MIVIFIYDSRKLASFKENSLRFPETKINYTRSITKTKHELR